MSKEALMAVGTRVLAVRTVGAVEEGQPGIVTGVTEMGKLFWKKHFYLCTFFGNVKLAMQPNEISEYDHGRSLAELERGVDPNLSVAEQMLQIRPLRSK